MPIQLMPIDSLMGRNLSLATPTNGQVLAWDDTNKKWAPANGTAPGGTTDGNIQTRGGGGTTFVGEDNLHWDTTNNRLSINAGTSPTGELHVKYNAANSDEAVPVLNLDNPSGGQQTAMHFRVNAVVQARLRASNVGNVSLESASGDLYLGTSVLHATNVFIGGSNGSPALVVPASSNGGDVVIRSGTTAGSALLHVGHHTFTPSTKVGFRVDSGDNTTVDLLQFLLNPGATSAVSNLATFGANSTGVPANGFGASFTHQLESSAADDQNAAKVKWLWTDATNATRSAAYAIEIVDNAAALAEMWRIAGNGSGTGTKQTLTNVTGGATTAIGSIQESLTLNTGSTTTDTTIDLPANSLIVSVSTRVTTTITTAVSFSVGDNSGSAGSRFSASAGGMSAGSTRVGIDQWNPANTNANGPVQTATAKVRITTNANPGAGVIRITIHYITLAAATS